MATTIDVVSLQPSEEANKDVLMDTEKKDDDASSNANSKEKRT